MSGQVTHNYMYTIDFFIQILTNQNSLVIITSKGIPHSYKFHSKQIPSAQGDHNFNIIKYLLKINFICDLLIFYEICMDYLQTNL